MYSERDAKARGLGWKRVGSLISYYKTSSYKSPLLQREYVYYTLTFHMVNFSFVLDFHLCSGGQI